MPLQGSQAVKQHAALQRPQSLGKRVAAWMTRAKLPAASFVALGLALMLGWHVVNGNNGLTNWQQKRAEDAKLRKEIGDLEQENARLRVHVQRLDNDPETLNHEVREKMQFVGEDEVIFKLPPQADQAAPVAKP